MCNPKANHSAHTFKLSENLNMSISCRAQRIERESFKACSNEAMQHPRATLLVGQQCFTMLDENFKQAKLK
jgi:hypothetical protein